MKPKKFHAIVPSSAAFTPNNKITGHWNLWRAPEGHQFLVCYPPHRQSCVDFVKSLGGVSLPDRSDPSSVGANAAIAVNNAGATSATDNAWTFLTKLAAHHGWPELDPNNESIRG